jgi:hypothetical protein
MVDGCLVYILDNKKYQDCVNQAMYIRMMAFATCFVVALLFGIWYIIQYLYDKIAHQ